MTGRAKIGFSTALEDLSSFPTLPRIKPAAPPAEAAELSGFSSREPAAPPVPRTQQRRYRTGRSAQINIKATPETIAAFQAWADDRGLSIAEAFEFVTGKLKDI